MFFSCYEACRDGDEKMARQLFVSDETVLNRRDEYYDFALTTKPSQMSKLFAAIANLTVIG